MVISSKQKSYKIKNNASIHISEPPPPPGGGCFLFFFFFFKREGGVNFDYLPGEGGKSEKLKKGFGSMVQGQVFLKKRGLTLFLFNFFKVNHFYI